MPLKLKRSRAARLDQSEIWLFIATSNMAAADRQMDQFNDAFYLLAEYPEAGPILHELNAIRRYPVDQYNVFYRVGPTTIEVVRVLHAARDVTPDLLSE